jgi:hypothetical protein
MEATAPEFANVAALRDGRAPVAGSKNSFTYGLRNWWDWVKLNP